MRIPPEKLESDPCNDNPTAKPAAPRMATNEDVPTPSCVITVIKSKMRKVQKRMLAKKLDNVGSNFLSIMSFLTILMINRMAKIPAISKTIAEIKLGAKATILL